MNLLLYLKWVIKEMEKYYKKIDKSVFKYGITIPKEYEEMFLKGHELKIGEGRNIKIKFKNKLFNGRINNVNRRNTTNVYQIRWDSNNKLINELKKEFIQSYFAIMSDEFNEKNINRKYNRTSLLGGNQEVLIFNSTNYNTIELETFIKVKTIYDNIFKEFVNRNVFGWISKQEYNQMVTKSTQWFDIKELKKHKDIPYVVYYLVDDINKEIYIGSATKLGDRVKPGRCEIPGWNKFRYEIIHPKYHKELKAIEYHSIMNFARFFNNQGNLRTLGISDYKLINKDYKFYQK